MEQQRPFPKPTSEPVGGDTIPGPNPPPSPSTHEGGGAPTGEPGTLLTGGSTVRPAPTEGPRDFTVPGYEILGELGRGGMGVVYKARQAKANRVVALKMILGSCHADLQDKVRFQIEVEAIARLQHANIVQLHEAGEHDDMPFFSLEFCDGGSLDRKLKGQGLPPRAAAALVEKLARAMHYAHSRGVVHRDLKPANVLLTADGEPKITDFGLAKRTDSGSDLSHSGAVMGTPSYMAPEQAAGKVHDIGPAADVYALGAILYELLTGRPPFKSTTAFDTICQVLNDEPAAPSQSVRKMPPDVETICLKCLRKEPSRRYPSALALADDLRRFLSGEPIEARPIGRFERLLKWVQRRPAVAALLAVLVLVTTLGSAGVLWNYFDAQEQKTRAQKQQAIAEGLAEDFRQQKEVADHKTAEEAQARVRAERAEGRAKEETRRAVEAEGRTKRERDRAEWLLYGSKMALAQREWQDGDAAAARTLLDQGRWAFQGWEYRYLYALFRSNQSTLLGHLKPITAIAYSPDGRRLATASADETIKVWDVAERRALLTLKRKTLGVTFRTKGKEILALDQNGMHGYETESGKELFHRPWVRGGLSGAAFSADGKCVALRGDHVSLWDVDQGKELRVLKPQVLVGPEYLNAPMNCLVFSADGKRLAGAGENGIVRVWEAESGKEIHALKGHVGPVRGVALSPDGKLLISGGVDRTARVWDLTTGKELRTLSGHTWDVQSVAFSHDGKEVATAGGLWDKTIRLWDPRTGESLGTLQGHVEPIRCLAFSPDDRSLASGSGLVSRVFTPRINVPGEVKVWGVRDVPPDTLEGHKGPVHCVAVTRDGRRVASGSADRRVIIRELPTGKEVVTLEGHLNKVASLSFSRDGRLLASHDGVQVKVWDTATGKAKQTIDTPNNRTTAAVVFHPEGERLAMTTDADEVRIWDLGAGRFTRTFRTPEACCLAYDSSGTRLAAGSYGGAVRVWDEATGKELLFLRGAGRCVAFSPDGKLLAAGEGGGWDDRRPGEIKVWDAATGKELLTLAGHAGGITAVAFTPGGRRLVSTSDDGTIKLWNLRTGHETLTLKGHSEAVNALAFSADGTRLVSGGADRTVRVWESPRLDGSVRTLPQHKNEVYAVAWSPKGEWIASAGGNKLGGSTGQVKVWDAATGQQLLSLRGPLGKVGDVVFSPDGKLLATCGGAAAGWDKLCEPPRLWDAQTGRLLHSLEGHTGAVFQAAFTADGKSLATAGQDKRVKVWDVATGKEALTLDGFDSPVAGVAFRPGEKEIAVCLGGPGTAYAVVRVRNLRTNKEVFATPNLVGTCRIAYSPDGRRLATASFNRLQIWDAEGGKKLHEIATDGTSASRCVAFSPDGKFLASTDNDVTLAVWETETGRKVGTRSGHMGTVTSVAFSAGGRRLVSGSEDRTVKVWESPRPGEKGNRKR